MDNKHIGIKQYSLKKMPFVYNHLDPKRRNYLSKIRYLHITVSHNK